MIKTFVNRHDMEYYLYAMVKAFYKDAEVLAPDKAEHNKPVDDVLENEDLLTVNIGESGLIINFAKGKSFDRDEEYSYTFSKGEAADEAELKDEIKGYIYDSLKAYTNRELPWGNLTGIRPTKLYMNLINSKNNQDILSYMKDRYRVSNEKNALGLEIAKRENAIIDSMHCNDGYSVYIGIPFCPSTCLYCSFTSNPIFSYKNIIADYLDAIKKELLATKEIMQNKFLDTIYIGGGTPTTLSADELDKLLCYITNILPMENVSEFTVEAGRADSITIDKFKVLKKYNVTRISINPQTMSDKTLKLIGRHHTSKDVITAFNMARELNFDNINMDMILGLPEENLLDVEYTLKEIEKLSPESLTVHSLAIKRASRMKEYMENNKLKISMNHEEAMKLSSEYAARMGLNPYYLYRQKDMAGNLENTGFAKEGKCGIYNILMMEEVQTIIACGAGTVTKRVYGDGRIERCDNVKDVALYIDKIDEMIERKRNLFAD